MTGPGPGSRGTDRGIPLIALGLAALVATVWLTACSGSAPGTSSAAPKTAFVQTQTVENYAVTLRVTPATFGSNTFSVTLKDTQGAPVTHATVEISTTMLDMDMGVQTTQLSPAGGASPGIYTGGSELPMAGHWQVAVQVKPSASARSFAVNFRFSAPYS